VIKSNLGKIRKGNSLEEHSKLLSKIAELVSPYYFSYSGGGFLSLLIKERTIPCNLTQAQRLDDLNKRLNNVLVHYDLPYTVVISPSNHGRGNVYGIELTEVELIPRADEIVEVMHI
jgi:hypothetical protein